MAETPQTRRWTPTDVMGFMLALAGLGLLAWSKADGVIPTPMLIAGALLIGAGMYLVDPKRAEGFLHEVQAVRAGRRETDPVVATEPVAQTPEPEPAGLPLGVTTPAARPAPRPTALRVED